MKEPKQEWNPTVNASTTIPESDRGFVTAPTLKQLELTKEEKAKLKQLLLWLEASKLDTTMWD